MWYAVVPMLLRPGTRQNGQVEAASVGGPLTGGAVPPDGPWGLLPEPGITSEARALCFPALGFPAPGFPPQVSRPRFPASVPAASSSPRRNFC